MNRSILKSPEKKMEEAADFDMDADGGDDEDGDDGAEGAPPAKTAKTAKTARFAKKSKKFKKPKAFKLRQRATKKPSFKGLSDFSEMEVPDEVSTVAEVNRDDAVDIDAANIEADDAANIEAVNADDAPNLNQNALIQSSKRTSKASKATGSWSTKGRPSLSSPNRNAQRFNASSLDPLIEAPDDFRSSREEEAARRNDDAVDPIFLNRLLNAERDSMPANVFNRNAAHRNKNAEDDDEDTGIIGTKETNKSEGERLFLAKYYQKAADCFTLAIGTDPKHPDPHCLVWRSRCYMKMGRMDKALVDAEASLSNRSNYVHGLLIKAKTLFEMGDFEFALVYYHRGNKLRPELEEFSVGVQICEEVILNCVGNADYKLTLEGDLSFLDTVHPQVRFMDADMKRRKENPNKSANANQDNKNNNCGMCKRPPRNQKADTRGTVRQWRQPKTVKMLLGDLYRDHAYLHSLLNEGDLIGPTYPVGKAVKREIVDAVNFMDDKADFWQAYKPIYARKGAKPEAEKKRLVGEELAMHIQRALEDIDLAQQEERWDDCLTKARLLLAASTKWNVAEITNKRVIISALRNYMGVSYTELTHFNRGLREHIMDLEEVSRDPVLIDNRSRALENMGRVYAKMGNYLRALSSWQQKEELCKSEWESVWVTHEIGRTYMEMGNYARSKEYALKSYDFAVQCDDRNWLLHASVLQAQSEAKMGEWKEAYKTFNRSLGHAEDAEEEEAADAIRIALKDIKLRLARKKLAAQATDTVTITDSAGEIDGGGGGDDGGGGGDDDGGGGDEGGGENENKMAAAVNENREVDEDENEMMERRESGVVDDENTNEEEELQFQKDEYDQEPEAAVDPKAGPDRGHSSEEEGKKEGGADDDDPNFVSSKEDEEDESEGEYDDADDNNNNEDEDEGENDDHE